MDQVKRGECQICGRSFKVREDGRLNMHGHQRAGAGRCGGWCAGSARLPVPAVDALEEQIAALRSEDAARHAGLIGKHERRLAALRTRNA